MTSIFDISEHLISPPSSPSVGTITTEHSSSSGSDQRALEKLALELSMLDMTVVGNGSEDMQQLMSHDGIVPGSTLNAFTSMLNFNGVHFDERKKSQNMTECVPVPSSEHVAEIVGRQGELNLLSFCVMKNVISDEEFFNFPILLYFEHR